MATGRPDLNEYLEFAHRLASLAGAHTLPHFRTRLEIEDKADLTPVTAADRGAEAAMRAMIRTTYPDHGILGEEHGRENPEARFCWVLDPIDGTKSFIIGVPLWATLIAFEDRGQAVLGIMDQPFTGERYTGGPDGSFLGHRRLATRRCPQLSRAALCSTGPELFTSKRQRDAFERVAARTRLTRFGTDSYAYCLLAHGLVDLVVEAGLKRWDIAALLPIVRSAGGVITNWDGGIPADGGTVIAAGDPDLHAAVLPLLAQST